MWKALEYLKLALQLALQIVNSQFYSVHYRVPSNDVILSLCFKFQPLKNENHSITQKHDAAIKGRKTWM